MKNVKILVVEDNFIIRIAISKALEKKGYKVKNLAEGSNFLNCVGEFEPHLIVMDLKLPDIDGFSLLEKLQRSQWSQIPVVVLSAFSFPSNEDRTLHLGVRRFLAKPITHNELLQVIEEELSQ